MSKFEDWERDNARDAVKQMTTQIVKYLHLIEREYGLDMWDEIIRNMEAGKNE